MLRPQDVLVALALAAHPKRRWTYAAVGKATGLSLSEAHSSLVRAAHAGLVESRARRAIKPALREFVVHGLRYAFPPELGPNTRGMPTAASIPEMQKRLGSSSAGGMVWPFARGTARGESLAPIYKTVPQIALEDEKLYALLATADAVRAGGAREREVASHLFSDLLDRAE
jgi:hypothetical protein